MRVLTFARHYPAYHPRKGEPTHFVEKIWNSQNVTMKGVEFFFPGEEYALENNPNVPYSVLTGFLESITSRADLPPKLHTIRAGHRWKAGDMFSPVVWSGRPYWTKQITFAPPMEVKAVHDFAILDDEWWLDKKLVEPDLLQAIATNDGLSLSDFISWFKWPKEFSGQVIIFGDVKY